MNYSTTHADAATARRYYLGVLVIWSLLSVAGNALHALEADAGTLAPVLSAVIATIPPITLFASTHSLVLQLRSAAGRSWGTRLVGIAILLAVTGSSFALSFTALRELAIMAGISPGLAPLMAVIIDAPVVHASIAMYYEARAANATPGPAVVADEAPSAGWTQPDRGSIERVAVDQLGSRFDRDDADTAVTASVRSHAPVPSGATTADIPVSDSEQDLVEDGAGFVDDDPRYQVQPSDLGVAELVMQRTNARSSTYIIARALMYVDRGYSKDQAAEAVGVHRTTLTRWLTAREEIARQSGQRPVAVHS